MYIRPQRPTALAEVHDDDDTDATEEADEMLDSTLRDSHGQHNGLQNTETQPTAQATTFENSERLQERETSSSGHDVSVTSSIGGASLIATLKSLKTMQRKVATLDERSKPERDGSNGPRSGDGALTYRSQSQTEHNKRTEASDEVAVGGAETRAVAAGVDDGASQPWLSSIEQTSAADDADSTEESQKSSSDSDTGIPMAQNRSDNCMYM